MIRSLIRRKLDSEEKKLGESMDYLRHVVDVSPGAFVRFASIMPFANSRRALPADAWFVAQVVGAQKEDCGPCLQITVNLARQEKVDPEMLRATLEGRFEDLPEDLAMVARFSQAVVDATYDEGELRAALRERYGDRGVVEIAYAIASSRIPPTVKRALGFARSCREVEVRL